MVISFVLGPFIIRSLKARQNEGQPIREDGPEGHLLTKRGTPTMGGVMIILSLTVSTLLWADLSNSYVWTVLLVTGGFGLIGFGDDYLKITKRNPKGLSSKFKFLAQLVVSAVAAVVIVSSTPAHLSEGVAVPFSKISYSTLVSFLSHSP